VAGGAAVLFFCSAPGLDGRRTDERGWREGHAWWLSSGLGDVVRHARRLAVPVAMATQAGSTEDEVPADVTVHPVREAVRCLVVDRAGRALLVTYDDGREVGHWGPPGGGLEAGEDLGV
jgi:hypothetical protein